MKINDRLNILIEPTSRDYEITLKAIYYHQWNNLSAIYRSPSNGKINRFDGYIRTLLQYTKLVDYWICDYDANDFCFVGKTKCLEHYDKYNFFIYTKKKFVLLFLVPQGDIDLYENKHSRRKVNRRTK